MEPLVICDKRALYVGIVRQSCEEGKKHCSAMLGNPQWLSDSNRTILAAKELRHIAQTLMRHLINPRFDVTLY